MNSNTPRASGLHLLPCAKDVCQECAIKHEPSQPHNANSLYYQYKFYAEQQRWPTWADAMAHCLPKTRERWTQELAKKGIPVTPQGENHDRSNP